MVGGKAPEGGRRTYKETPDRGTGHLCGMGDTGVGIAIAIGFGLGGGFSMPV